MSKKVFRVRFALLLAILFVVLFSGVGSAQSSSYELLQSGFEVSRQVSGSSLDVVIWVFLSGRYTFWDLNVRNEVVLDITLRLVEPPPMPYVVSASISFSWTEVSGLPSGANYTYGFWGTPPAGVLSIYVPANTSYFSIKVKGHLPGNSVFWRNTVETPSLNVTSSVAYVSSYQFILVPPSPSRILRAYSRFYPDLRYNEANIEGQRIIIVSEIYPRIPVVILYESETWETYALISMCTMVFMVFAVPYALKSKKFSVKQSKLTVMFQGSLLNKVVIVLRRLYGEILKMNSSKLLSAYILCALLMTSLSFAVGPDPRLKVYVLASTPENAKTISDFVYKEVDAVAITVYDEMTEFETLADLGVFSAVIVGDFIPPTERMVKTYIYPALDCVPYIIILKNYAFDVFSSEIMRRYADKTRVIENLAALGPFLPGMPKRANALGLNVSPEMYMGISALVGLFSFIIMFFGLAFLACKLIEVGKKPGAGGFPEAIAYSVLIFFFTQTMYIVCSVLLAMPLGLHAGSPKVTAVGFMGFGGGSNPRRLVGLVGFLFGSLISLKEGLRLDKFGFASFLMASFFIIIDPLTSGIIFYEFVLLFTVGPIMEQAYTSLGYFKLFLRYIADAFGAWVSPTYGISTSVIFYYASAIPFCLFAKLKKSTATALLLFCALFVSSGCLRVADMNPWKAMASVIPGVTTGFLFVIILYLFNFVETIIRKKFGV